MIQKRTIKVLVFFLIINGCNGFDHEEKINANKYLIANQGIENMNISIQLNNEHTYLGIVHACVFAVGYNESYIIAKQHPYDFGKPINKNITNYYIIPAQGKGTYADQIGVIGPLTENDFNKKRQELEIDKLKFTKVFKELE
jgi:hypothetical protein